MFYTLNRANKIATLRDLKENEIKKIMYNNKNEKNHRNIESTTCGLINSVTVRIKKY